MSRSSCTDFNDTKVPLEILDGSKRFAIGSSVSTTVLTALLLIAETLNITKRLVLFGFAMRERRGVRPQDE